MLVFEICCQLVMHNVFGYQKQAGQCYTKEPEDAIIISINYETISHFKQLHVHV